MDRDQFQHDGLTFSSLDAGGAGQPLVALHSHWLEGMTYAPLAAALAPDWRVIALDQRGHGHSDHAPTYTRDDYLGDVLALFTHLGLNDAVLLGNSSVASTPPVRCPIPASGPRHDHRGHRHRSVRRHLLRACLGGDVRDSR